MLAEFGVHGVCVCAGVYVSVNRTTCLKILRFPIIRCVPATLCVLMYSDMCMLEQAKPTMSNEKCENVCVRQCKRALCDYIENVPSF